MFKRLLVLSVCERAADADMENNRKRPAMILKIRDTDARASACGASMFAAGGND
jgi:hypothetical protein